MNSLRADSTVSAEERKGEERSLNVEPARRLSVNDSSFFSNGNK